MTRVRNFLCVVLTLIIACLCTVIALPASAEEINVADMKEYLREIDIPEEFLDTIDETGVQDMYYKLHNHNVSVDVYQTTTLPAEGVKNTRAGISEDALKFSMVVTSIFPDVAQYSHLYNKYQAQVGFTFTYNGYVEPTVTFLVTADTSTAAISTNYSYRYDN